MSDLAIQIENLGKKYKYGQVAQLGDSLRGDLAAFGRRLFRRPGKTADGRPQTADRRPQTSSDVHEPASGKSAGCSLPAAVPAPPSSEYFWALKDINLEVRSGEVLGIIGRNGAGKSTLLKILSRITPPTTGSITYHGRVSSLLEVGAGFHRELTGRENVFLNGSILGMSRKEMTRKFDEIVAFAEVEKFIDTPVKFYSSGMYVRLAFAVAAHLEPEILVIDEVLAVGDAAFQKKCLGKMGEVSKQGRTVLFVSHNMQAIAGLCNRAVLIDSGRIVEAGQAADVVGKYLKASTNSFSSEREQIWDMKIAPGNVRIRLHRISLQVETDDPSQEIRLDTPLRMVIEYWNLVAQTPVVVNLCVYSADGSAVFEDWTAEEANWRGRAFPRGLFRTTCTIPEHLLNEGHYRIRILFFDLESTKPLYDHEQASLFYVNDLVERPVAWYGRFMGPVRPKLRWTTELIRIES